MSIEQKIAAATALRDDGELRRHAVDAVIKQRFASRTFSQAPVLRQLIEDILEVARFAPSGANIQPWRVYVLGGAEKHRVSQALMTAHREARDQHSSEYQYYAPHLPEPYLSRREEFGRLFYGSLGIQQSDMAARAGQTAKNYDFFGAPVGLIIAIDRRLQVGSWLDLGMFMQNVMIAAGARGLQTCPQETFAKYHALLRDHLPIPAEEMVACGMSIGFAEDACASAGSLMPKAPVSEFAKFGALKTRAISGEVDQGRMTMEHRRELIERSIPFLQEVKDMTPGADMERWLNRKYGEDSDLYKELSRLIRLGVEEGWAANQEVDGPNYRRSRILDPSPETFHFSITAVYMNSEDARAFKDDHDDDVLRGQFHGHPYGELNMVIPIDAGAELKGLQGWQGPGWTAPDPGSRHYPEVKGGALIALFYLPAGRISYDFKEPV